ncbi:MAG: outer membrane protein assembly factor BamA [Desulfobacterales bacterium]|nr:outer membrane protein assembly factor BamA [Desulfobacterales bacterium]
MDKSSKKKIACNGHPGLCPGKQRLFRVRVLALLFILVFLIPSMPIAEKGEEAGPVVVLPFRVYALKTLDHLQPGLQKMLVLRMEKRGFDMISPEVINSHPLAFSSSHESKDYSKIGQDLEAAWVIAGSATRIGKKISLDLQVIDVTKKRPPFSVFMVSEDIDALSDTMRQLSISVDHQIAGVAQVDSVHVYGNERIEEEAILAVVGTRKGDRLDYKQLDMDLQDIFKMGFFEDVKIETEDGPKGKTITFQVIEKPPVGQIAFKGNKEVDDKDLREELGIKLYSILDENEIRQSINRLTDFYRQKGYYNVDIKEKTEKLPNNEVLLEYEIAENDKVYISEIEFTGNNEFDDGDLKSIMETSEKGFFSWITDSGFLDTKKLDFDVHNITSYYHNNGYIKAKAGKPVITYDEEDKGLNIAIEIHEGIRYGVGEVTVTGDLIKPAGELIEKVRINKGKFFSREVLRKDIMTLRDIYVDEGYAYADVAPGSKADDETRLVDIRYDISKGKKVRFERINITGNTVTRDKVIRREINAVEGEYFSGLLLKSSEANLHRLGFFEDIEMKTKKGSSDDLMILDVNVKEQRTGSFSVGAGYSGEDGAFAMFQISQNNLFGRGQKLQGSAKLGGRTTQTDVKFIEPWLFDTPISFSFDIYKFERDYEDLYSTDNDDYDDYTRDGKGTRISFGYPLTKNRLTRATVRYGLDHSDISGVPDDASEEVREMEGQNVTSSITLGISRDSRDEPWNTHKGSLNSFSVEYAGGVLGGDVYFTKYRLRSAWYFPLFWNTVFLAAGNCGYVQKSSGGKLPIYQKFQLGGMSSVRGFDYGDISPRDEATGDRVGGEKMMYFNFEYRFPLLTEQGIVGLVFFDAGNVLTDADNTLPEDDSFAFDDLRKSVGGGIRWYSPMGPLRLEYGKNLDPQEGEKSGRWEFSVGGLF